MSARTRFASVAACTVFLGACFDPTSLPEVDLDAPGARAVLRCQEKIKVASRIFVNAKLKELHTCVDKLVEVEVRADSGLLSERRLARTALQAETDCERAFERIGKIEGTYIDSIVKSCEGVEDEILLGADAGDPLGIRTLAEGFSSSTSGEIDIQSLEDYASFLCGMHELSVLLLVTIEAPRAVGLLDGVGLGVFGDDRCNTIIDEGDLFDIL